MAFSDNNLNFRKSRDSRNKSREIEEDYMDLFADYEIAPQVGTAPIKLSPSYLDDLDDLDGMEVGAERDETDHLGDIKKLSLRDLDKKSKDEQNRILKTEYLHTLDKAGHLNKIVAELQKEVGSSKMKIADSQKQNRQLRSIVTSLTERLPGADELKKMTETGNFDIKEVATGLDAALKKLRNRLTDLDKEIEDGVKEATEGLKIKIYQMETQIDEQEHQIANLTDHNSHLMEENENQATLIEKMESRIAKFKEAFSKVSVIQEWYLKQTGASKKQVEETVQEQVEKPKPENKVEALIAAKKELPKAESQKEEVPKDKPTSSFKLMDEKEAKTEIKKEEQKTEPVKETLKAAPVKFDSAPKTPEKVKAEPVAEKKESPSFKPFFSGVFEQPKKAVKKEEVLAIFDDNIEQYLDSINDNQKTVLRLIGQSGISRYDELIEEAQKDAETNKIYFPNGKLDKEKLKETLGKDLKTVRDKGLLEKKVVKMAEKGNQTIDLFRLTTIGKQVYKKHFKDNPAYSEIDGLEKEHGSLQKAFIIRDMDKHFTQKGYTKGKHELVDAFYEKDGEKLPILVQLETDEQADVLDRYNAYFNEFGPIIYTVYANEKMELSSGKGKQFFSVWLKENGGHLNAMKLGIAHKASPINRIKSNKPNIWAFVDFSKISV